MSTASAVTPGGDRPLWCSPETRSRDRIGSVVVAALTRTMRGLVSELPLTPADGVPTDGGVKLRQHPHDPRGRRSDDG